MKNFRFIALLALSVTLVCGLIWWRTSRSVTAGQEDTETNTVAETAASQEKKPSQSHRISRPSVGGDSVPNFAQASAEQQRQFAEMGVTPGMTKEEMQQRLSDWTRAQREVVAENWRKPIEFYGKVIDQNNRPVANVQIHFIWTDTSANGSSESNQSTDTQGKFALSGQTGRLLQVWLSKEGYYVPKTNQNNFDYATGFMAVSDNPVIFRLVKKGEGADLITSQHGCPAHSILVCHRRTALRSEWISSTRKRARTAKWKSSRTNQPMANGRQQRGGRIGLPYQMAESWKRATSFRLKPQRLVTSPSLSSSFRKANRAGQSGSIRRFTPHSVIPEGMGAFTSRRQ